MAVKESKKPEISSYGTGFFITKNGYIVTCNHVVEGANNVKIKVKNKIYDAKIVQTDQYNDLALLKVNGNFPALSFSNRRTAKLGETAFTIGYPNPDLQGKSAKLTKGEVSSLKGVKGDPRLYQISVPVNPGNSGGALLNQKGEIIGVVNSSLDEDYAYKQSGGPAPFRGNLFEFAPVTSREPISAWHAYHFGPWKQNGS